VLIAQTKNENTKSGDIKNEGTENLGEEAFYTHFIPPYWFTS